MTANDLRLLRNRKPFEPFRLVTSDGAHYDVTNPEWLWVLANATHVAIPSPGQPEQPDDAIRLANDDITHTLPLGTDC